MKHPISIFAAVEKPKATGFDEYELLDVENWLSEWMLGEPMTKGTAPLFNLNEYANDYRCNDNVIRSTGILMDFDSGYRMDVAKGVFEEAGYWAWLYTSPRHQPDAHRFRAVVPLLAPITNNEDYKRCWHALNELMNRQADKQTKDISRCYYVPGRYVTAGEHIIYRTDGNPVDPKELFAFYDDYLRDEFEPPPPKPKPKRRQTGKRSAWMQRILEGAPKVFNWTGVHDCPFVNSSKLEEYLSSPHGTHHGGLFKLACSIAGRARTMEYDLSQHELAALMQDAHWALPCYECKKGHRKYMEEAGVSGCVEPRIVGEQRA